MSRIPVRYGQWQREWLIAETLACSAPTSAHPLAQRQLINTSSEDITKSQTHRPFSNVQHTGIFR